VGCGAKPKRKEKKKGHDSEGGEGEIELLDELKKICRSSNNNKKAYSEGKLSDQNHHPKNTEDGKCDEDLGGEKLEKREQTTLPSA